MPARRGVDGARTIDPTNAGNGGGTSGPTAADGWAGEANLDVGDKANDAVRVNADELARDAGGVCRTRAAEADQHGEHREQDVRDPRAGHEQHAERRRAES